jgi:ribosomal protein S27AE
VSAFEEHKRAMREMSRPPMLRQCPECRGSGFLSARLDVSPAVMRTLAHLHPKEPVENYIKRQECVRCGGTGGI